MAYLHRGLLYSSEDDSSTTTPSHVEGSHTHSSELNEPNTNEHLCVLPFISTKTGTSGLYCLKPT